LSRNQVIGIQLLSKYQMYLDFVKDIYIGTRVCKSPLRWCLFVVEEPNNCNYMLSKNQVLRCCPNPSNFVFRFSQDSVILILRCPRALYIVVYLLSKNQIIVFTCCPKTRYSGVVQVPVMFVFRFSQDSVILILKMFKSPLR
jgi:hypothetical protein